VRREAVIVRLWRARAGTANERAYADHFRRNVLPQLEAIPGFRGATLLRAARGDEVELVVLTRWRSMDAIRAFAGEEVERAVVEPEAAAALVDYDLAVSHYEIVEETRHGVDKPPRRG